MAYVMAEYSRITLPADGKRVSPEPIYVVVGVSMGLMALFQAIPAEWRDLLRYDRDAVAAGEAWRLLTGNFVHLGWSHLALNLLGLGIGTWMFARYRRRDLELALLWPAGANPPSEGSFQWCGRATLLGYDEDLDCVLMRVV